LALAGLIERKAGLVLITGLFAIRVALLWALALNRFER
jgi:hypothetical protein